MSQATATTTPLSCPVITSRNARDEAQQRVTDLDDAMVGLESDEVTCRKLIDTLLSDTSDDGVIKYQMQSENLAAIKSKQQHVRQSKGVAYRASLDALDNYRDDLTARTRKRKVALYADINSKLPALLETLTQAAESYMVNFSIVNGLPIRTIDLNKILRKQPGFVDSIQNQINTIEYNLEADNYESL